MFHKMTFLILINLYNVKNLTGEDSKPYCNIVQIMLVLWLMLSGAYVRMYTYYAENYAGIICLNLSMFMNVMMHYSVASYVAHNYKFNTKYLKCENDNSVWITAT